MELAGKLDINTREADLRLSDLGTFREAFVTNSTMEIMPLVSIRDETGKTATIGDGKPGDMTQRLMVAYKEKVSMETTL